MASSCVPGVAFESPRRELTPGDLDALLRRRRVIGLAEMMNFPGVVGGDAAELAKLGSPSTSTATRRACAAATLNAYVAAGIRSDHEAYTAEEGRERLRAGMWLLIREALGGAQPPRAAAAARRVRAGPHRVLHRRPRAGAHRRRRPHQRDGARAVAAGSRPRTRSSARRSTRRSVTASTHLGAVAPGYRADLLVLHDLERFVPGRRAEGGQAGRGDPARRRARLGAPHGAHRRARAGDVPRPVERRRARG